MENDSDFNGGFRGAKLLLFVGDKIATLLRDDIETIPDPGRWDFPGGGRDGIETAKDCVLRELKEELNLTLAPDALVWARRYYSAAGTSVFFAAHIPACRAEDISLGNEGQAWTLMVPEAYLAHPRNIPRFAERLRAYLVEWQSADR